MILQDHLWLGFSNLWQNKLRTFLTTLGVVVGIGALIAMISFGTGMQKNITQALKDNDLFTSIYVTSRKVDINQMMSGDLSSMAQTLQTDGPALNDSIITLFNQMENVELAYPELRFPVKVLYNGEEANTQLQAMPPEMGAFKPFNNLTEGTFFSQHNEPSAIISKQLLKDLKVRLKPEDQKKVETVADSLMRIGQTDKAALIGQKITLISTVIDVKRIAQNPFTAMMSPDNLPMQDDSVQLTIAGIRDDGQGFTQQRFGRLIVPSGTAQQIPHLGFSNVYELLNRHDKSGGYASVYVRIKKMRNLEEVQKSIEEMGFGVFSIADQFEEIKRGFLIMDAMLGAVGTIALFVAALGIANTLIMSILERTREIGIMKAIGGSENEIKSIFLIEAATIGFWGGILGWGLGWIVTRIANFVANHYIIEAGGTHVQLFYIPLWLIASGVAFSILISVLAGLYPAIRAARVDPVRALRHD